jgi:hypothetical protein
MEIHGKSQYQYSQLPWFKGLLTVGVFFLILLLSPYLGEFFTFLILDILLSAYLCSLFRSPSRLMFFIHPIFVYLSGTGFQIPYPDIGVGYTYFVTFDKYVDPEVLSINWELIVLEILHPGEGSFLGFTTDYLGVIPILWFPKILFSRPSPTAFYYSLSLWSLICAAIGVNIATTKRVLRERVLVTMALCMTVSPTFLEINSSVHRYHLMVLGLFVIFISYVELTRIPSKLLSSLPTMLFGVLCLGVSKPLLFLSVITFVFLDLVVRNKIEVMNYIGRITPIVRWALIIGLVALLEYLASNYIVPEQYVAVTSKTGGGFFSGLAKIPVLGLIFRILIAIQSPAPWLNFSQWSYYGFNRIFLGIHVLSAIFSFWLVLSLFSRIKYILRGSDDTRSCAIFGVALMASLSFSAIGFHVYWSPVVPFLGPLLLERYSRISFIYPLQLAIITDLFLVVSSPLRNLG